MPNHGNLYYFELFDNEQEDITDLKALQLADNSEIICLKPGVAWINK